LDILRLIRLVETKVLEKTGIKLDREIQLLGNFTL
jgi:UDP-N-acetylenolpyruvoylglucosamine reductase